MPNNIVADRKAKSQHAADKVAAVKANKVAAAEAKANEAKSYRKVVGALAMLEDFIRSAPQTLNASSALGHLNGVASHLGRINDVLRGLSAGTWDERVYKNEDETVDVKAMRLERNENIAKATGRAF